MILTVDLQIACDNAGLPEEDSITAWAHAALSTRHNDTELSVRIVDEAESQALNAEFRGNNKPTNVLSFPFELPEGIPESELNGLLGDLVICAPVIEREAREQQKPVGHHWAHMIVHGTLHLLGYDHIEDAEAEAMEQLEREILATINIPDPYKGEREDIPEP